MCRSLGIRTTFKSRGALREAMVQTKEPHPVWRKKGVVYQVPCAECNCAYIGETGRSLEKRLSEHRGAVKRNDTKNGIAVHAWKTQHKVDNTINFNFNCIPASIYSGIMHHALSHHIYFNNGFS